MPLLTHRTVIWSEYLKAENNIFYNNDLSSKDMHRSGKQWNQLQYPEVNSDFINKPVNV